MTPDRELFRLSDLMREFGVSRTAILEAIKTLGIDVAYRISGIDYYDANAHGHIFAHLVNTGVKERVKLVFDGKTCEIK